MVTILLSCLLTAAVFTFGAVGYWQWQGERMIESRLATVLEKAEIAEYQEDGIIKDPTPEQQRISEMVGRKSHEERQITVARLADPAVVSVVSEAETASPEREFHDPFSFFFDDPFQPQPEEEQVGGSGFIVSSDGYMITNRHVVERDDLNYQVLTNEGERFETEVVERDPVLDIAVLKIQEDSEFEYLSFADSDDLQLGQSVMAIGNALGEFQNSVSTGVVSGLSRSITAGGARGQTEFLDEVIQTDAAINFGNSGGPLLDLEGRVIGVNVAMAFGSQNIGFAIPSNLVSPVVDSVRETGRIARAFLGIRYVSITPLIQEQEDLPVDYGVLIVESQPGREPSVVPGSPAQEAGLQEGDIVLEVDGRRLDRQHSLAHIIRQRSAGDEVEMVILRDGDEMTVTATLVEAPQDQ